MTFLPEKYIIRASIGKSNHRLGAFDDALLRAGVGNYNLIRVSSILPPACVLEDEITLAKGALLPSAFASISSADVGETISAAVAVGVPVDPSMNGVIMEHSAFTPSKETEETVRTYVRQAMLARGLEIKDIISISSEVTVVSDEIHCAFATVSMW